MVLTSCEIYDKETTRPEVALHTTTLSCSAQRRAKWFILMKEHENSMRKLVIRVESAANEPLPDRYQ